MKKIYESQLNSIEMMAADIELFLEENEIDGSIVFMLNLCLDELFTNIITYGYNEAPDKEIELSMKIEGDEIITIIKDSSPKFDPNVDAPEADTSSALEDRHVGGLGIFLCKKNMDRFEYKYVDGKNEQTLVKKFR